MGAINSAQFYWFACINPLGFFLQECWPAWMRPFQLMQAGRQENEICGRQNRQFLSIPVKTMPIYPCVARPKTL